MKHNSIFAGLAAIAVCAVSMTAPIVANAQSGLDRASNHRQKTKNDWRNIAIGSGAATAYGLLSHNNTVSILGAAGTLYSLSRYEHDRKSQSSIDRARADRYGRSSYYDHGHRYVRHTVNRNGHKYYTFQRG
jgi:hypothetical protein